MIDESLNRLELGDRLIRVDALECVEHTRCECSWRQGCTDDEFCSSRTILRGWIVNLPARVSLHTFFVDIIDDPDDTQILRAVCQHVTQRIVVWPMCELGQKMGKALVDQHHFFIFWAIVPSKITPAQTGSHGAQISRRHHVNQWPARHLIGVPYSLGPRCSPFAVLR